MSTPIPKAIATAVTLTVAAAALLTFTRGDDSKPSVPSAATVPNISGTTAPQVTGHTPKPKPTATPTPSATERATITRPSKPSTTTASSHGSTTTPTTPAPSPSPTPANAGLLASLLNALHPHH